jgi:hemerythrin-like metal-binding protein
LIELYDDGAPAMFAGALLRGVFLVALIAWSPQYEVGHPVIDAQHKELVAIINRLHEAMLARRGRESLATVFQDLASYTRMHFGTEEELMARFSYIEAAQHKKMHESLLGEIRKLEQGFKEGELSVTMATMTFLQSWLTTHIAQMDKKLASHLQKRG